VQEDAANSREMKIASKIKDFARNEHQLSSALIRTVLHLKQKRSATRSATSFLKGVLTTLIKYAYGISRNALSLDFGSSPHDRHS